MAANSPGRRLAAPALTGLLGTWRSAEGTRRSASYRELAGRIELLVVDGRVPPGSRLPAERELATSLSVSRTTVAGAYNALRERGLLLSHRGSGSIVTLPPTAQVTPANGPATAADLSHATLPGWDELPRHFAAADEHLPGLLRTHALDFYGTPELRTRLADRFTARGVPTSTGQILVTLGAQHALGLILRAYGNPGDRIAVDVPTYPHALDAFRDARARLVPVPMPNGAIDAAEWERTLLTVGPALAYLMPDFHNPTGTSITDPDRQRIIAAAARAGTILIADETTAELDIDRPIPTTPFAAFARRRDTTVISIGSASKTMWHGLRIGWIRADTGVIDRIASRRPASDLGTPVLEQLVVASVLPEMDQLLAVRRGQLQDTRDAVLQTLHELLPTWTVPTTYGGLCLWANIGDPTSTTLALTARTRGLTITSGPRFGLDGAFDRHIRIPITAPAANATTALTLLADAWAHTPHASGNRHVEFDPLL